jgi:8-oxo-dGTP diphosphatase
MKEHNLNHVKSLKVVQSEVQIYNKVALSIDCVIFGFDENKLKVLLIRSDMKKFHSRWTL